MEDAEERASTMRDDHLTAMAAKTNNIEAQPDPDEGTKGKQSTSASAEEAENSGTVDQGYGREPDDVSSSAHYRGSAPSTDAVLAGAGDSGIQKESSESFSDEGVSSDVSHTEPEVPEDISIAPVLRRKSKHRLTAS